MSNGNSEVSSAPRGLGGQLREIFSRPEYLCFFFGFICVALWVVGVVNNGNKEESGWLTFLFAIPLLIQLYALHYFLKCLREQYKDDNEAKAFFKHYLWLMGSFLCCLFVLWSWYLYRWAFTYMSYVTLALIGVYLVPVWLMTFAVMRPKKGKHSEFLKDLRRYALQMPVLSILFSFTLFIGISYLFSFALAFHDRTTPDGRPALFMPEWYASEQKSETGTSTGGASASEPSGPGSPAAAVPGSPPIAAPPPPYSGSGSEYAFYFEKGRSKLEVDVDRESRGEPDAYYRREVNYSSLEKVKTALGQLVKDGRGARVLVKGGADAEGFKQGETYSSNYELSEARAASARSRIQDTLKGQDWRYLEWETVPASSEIDLPKLTTAAEGQMKPEDLRRVVVVSVIPISADPSFQQRENHKAIGVWIGEVKDEFRNIHSQADLKQPKNARLRLIEYVYFTIYTITTTGYGDIVPTTGYAKFLVSFANLCEVFFLVVFFNALISSSKGKKHKRWQKGREGLGATQSLGEPPAAAPQNGGNLGDEVRAQERTQELASEGSKSEIRS